MQCSACCRLKMTAQCAALKEVRWNKARVPKPKESVDVRRCWRQTDGLLESRVVYGLSNLYTSSASTQHVQCGWHIDRTQTILLFSIFSTRSAKNMSTSCTPTRKPPWQTCPSQGGKKALCNNNVTYLSVSHSRHTVVWSDKVSAWSLSARRTK